MSKSIRWVLGFIVILLIVAAAIILFLIQRLQSDPIPLTNANDGLAFIGDRDGTWDIFYLDADENLRNLTNGTANQQDYFASWSLNGQAINFLSNRSGQMGPAQVKPDDPAVGVRTLSPVEALVQMVNEGLVDWDPAWSPDATQMTYASLANGIAVNLDMYLLQIDTGQRQRLTADGPGGPNDWFMAWAPDATHIAYNSNREGAENLYLWSLAENTSTPLTQDDSDNIHAAWALDGMTILFVSERELALADGNLDLWLMDADGGNVRPFNEETDTFTGDPVYSANGEQVAYMSNDNEDARWSIYIMNSDGTESRRVTPADADYLFPAWRPIPQTASSGS